LGLVDLSWGRGKLLSRQLSPLLILCGCSIVSARPGAIVSTIVVFQRRFERGRTVGGGGVWVQGLETFVQTTRKTFVQTICGSFVQQIEPVKDAVRMEEGVEFFSTGLSGIL
jgi:hypothetical protein